MGADVCGFAGSRSGGGATGIDGAPMADWAVDAELCTRWFSAGALLYSFFRVHTMAGRPHQHPGVFPEEPFRSAQRAAAALRYELIPYLYTLHAQAAAGGPPPLRSMGVEFGGAAGAPRGLRRLAEQAMLGPALLVAPALRPGVASVRAYLPGSPESWFDFVSGARVAVPRGGWAHLPAPLSAPPPVLLRGGQIVPSLQPGVGAGRGGARATTGDAPGILTCTVALPLAPDDAHAHSGSGEGRQGVGTAAGRLYWDDGTELGGPTTGLWVALEAGQAPLSDGGADPRSDRRGWFNASVLGSSSSSGGGDAGPPCLRGLRVLGASESSADAAGRAGDALEATGLPSYSCVATPLWDPEAPATVTCTVDAATGALSLDFGACVGLARASVAVAWELREDHRAGEL